eukprot:gene28637-37617_t
MSHDQSAPASSGDACAICLEVVQLRGGGVPLHSPGCCGKWFHQKCIVEYVHAGVGSTAKCPSCRSDFEVPPWMRTTPQILAHQVPAQPVHAQPVPVQQFQFQQSAAPPPPPSSSFFGRLFSSRSSPADGGEDLLPVVSTLTDVSAAREKNIRDLQKSISITMTPEYNVIGLSAVDAFSVRVGLQYNENGVTETISTDVVGNCSGDSPQLGKTSASPAKDTAANPSTVGLDIVCILDNSGSMTGSKLESLKTAMKFVIQSLGSNDRLAICYFNSDAGNLHGLLRMSASNKSKSTKIIRDQLNAGGGTNILAGMQCGAQILDTRRTRNTASCVFLLTDGQDRSNTPEKIALARRLKDNGTALFVFGFGSDHDAEHMMAISQAAEGGFSYIETDDTVADAFGGALGSLQGNILLTNLTLCISSALAGVQITSANAGRYNTVVDSSRTSASVSFANIFCGEKRDILLQLSVPLAPGPCYSTLLSASLQYSALGESYRLAAQSSSSSTSAAASCGVERLADDDERLKERSRALGVDEQINRFTVTTATGAAITSADNGNMAEARRILNQAIVAIGSSPSYAANSAISVALMRELKDALGNTESRERYDRGGGKSSMFESLSSNVQQRSTYTKAGKANMYQSSSSASAQQVFNGKKGGF